MQPYFGGDVGGAAPARWGDVGEGKGGALILGGCYRRG